jgi:hypothetical protein
MLTHFPLPTKGGEENRSAALCRLCADRQESSTDPSDKAKLAMRITLEKFALAAAPVCYGCDRQ